MSSLSFIHRFERGARQGARPLLILHGTGGDEDDLIPLGEMVAPGAPLLSPRGKVLEHGCRDSFADSLKASSMRRTFAHARTSSRTSSRQRATNTASERLWRSAIP